MIRYEYKNYKNIYLEDGYKVYTEAIFVEDIADLHKIIDWAMENLEEFKTDPCERNIFRYVENRPDKFSPETISYWEHKDQPVVYLAG